MHADALKKILAKFPRVALGHRPTPLEPMPRLSPASGAALWIKRDDCTGLGLGGNKSRQLEFYLGDALAQDCDCVLSTGAVQSNYMRMLAAAAAKVGLECHVQLEHRVQNADEDYHESGNVLLGQLFGATIHRYADGEDETGADASLGKIAKQLADAGRKPYIIPLGGIHKPIGALGYVDAACELLAQMQRMPQMPAMIVVGSGSGLTHAGLLTGLRLLDCETPVIGACVRRDRAQQHARIRRHCDNLAAMLGEDNRIRDDDIRTDDRTLWPGYGEASDMVHRAIQQLARAEGVITDPVYSGKALALTLALADEAASDAPIVMLHTGGVPAVFAYRRRMQQIATDLY